MKQLLTAFVFSLRFFPPRFKIGTFTHTPYKSIKRWNCRLPVGKQTFPREESYFISVDRIKMRCLCVKKKNSLTKSISLILPDEEALCPVVVPPLGSDKFHINSCLIHAVSPWGTKDSPCPSPIASRTYSHQLRFGLGLGQHGKKGGKKIMLSLWGSGLA